MSHMPPKCPTLHRAKYLLKFHKVRNAVILAPAIATNMTWIPFLTINREKFRIVRSNADLETVPEGVFLILSTSILSKLKRGLPKFVRRTSGKLCLVDGIVVQQFKLAVQFRDVVPRGGSRVEYLVFETAENAQDMPCPL